MKNHVKKSLAIFMAFMMFLCAVPFVAGAEGALTENGYTYTVENGEATITDCDDSISGDVVIPSELGGCPVTSIGYAAFSGCTGLASVTIPDSVTSIGWGAFSGCTGLTSITIPDSVTSIRDSVFENCTGLTSITIGNSVTNIGDEAFYNCTGLTSVTIGNSVTNIGDEAFYNCTGLTSVTIPDSVTSIGNGAFAVCTGLTSITIPDTVTSIGNYAFAYCFKLSDVSFGNSIVVIGDYAFLFSGIESVEIPETVKSIGEASFGGTGQLKNVTLPEGIEEIGRAAFASSAYDDISIPSSVKSIGEGAFSGCWNLKSINVNLDNANYCAIDGVLFDKDVSCLNSYPTGKEDTFYKIPDSVTAVYGNAANNLKQIVFPQNIKLYETVTTDEGTSEETDIMFGFSIEPFCFTGNTIEEFEAYTESYEELKAIENFTVYGYAGTDAEKYADKNNFVFVDLNGEHTHTFGEWAVTKEATCTAEGEETRTCSVCEETETRTIAKTGHTDSNKDGKCDRCGGAIEGYNPSANCTHICHKGGISKFFYKIALFFWKLFKINKECSCGVYHY